ncbi:Hypothetical protein PHPALM_11524 [Phytophthora palmivora]|uniref:Uncharacterized protein n=1 Tax=Phytophthora palmivora TaxID=4796 RepID=A0A2P4Y203_9STRA|nr:Hypothetical protein PHPALM_11524 [Phytophthora palmivora]
MDSCEIIWQLNKDFGQGNAAGFFELTRSWTKLTRTSWRDLRTFFAKQTARSIERLESYQVMTWSRSHDIALKCSAKYQMNFGHHHISMKKEDFTVDQVESALHCSTKAGDRDPNRSGGPILRTDLQTVKTAKTTKLTSINTIKAVVNEVKQHHNEEEKTQLET